MALLAIMGDRTQNPKLTSRTPSAFKEAVEDLKIRLQRERRWLYCGEKVSLEAIVNVAVLEFLEMDPAVRSKVMDARIPQIEAMFEAEDVRGETKTPAKAAGGEGGGFDLGSGGRVGKATYPGEEKRGKTA
jgi:hypothetical protein